MIGQEEYFSQPKVVQNLCANSVVAIDTVTRFKTCFRFTDLAFLHQRVSTQLIHQIQAVLTLSQVQHNSTSFSGDLFERSVKLESRVVNQGTKHIARKIFSVNTYENGFIGSDIAHYHCQMYITVDDVFVGNR